MKRGYLRSSPSAVLMADRRPESLELMVQELSSNVGLVERLPRRRTMQILGTVPGTDAGLLQRWIVAPLIQGWWAEQIRFNAVTHTAGSSSQTYIRLPNGKFLPPGAVLPADGDPTSYWKLTQTGAPTGYGTKWEFDTVSFTLESPSRDVQSFAYWKRTVRDTNRPRNFGQHIGWHVTSWSWPKGVSLTFSYVPNDNSTWVNDHLAFVQNSLGRRLNFTFSPSSDWDSCRLQSVNDNGARTASFNCAANSVTSPAGDVSKVTYGASNCGIGTWPNRAVRPRCSPYLFEVFGASDGTDPKIRLGYDAVGRVDQYFDAVAIKTSGQRAPYGFFIAEGVRGERKDPAGGAFVVDYDNRGRPVRTTDELGQTAAASFDGLGRVTRRTSPEGIQTEFAYDDARGTIKQVKTTPKVTVPATIPADLTVNATYDPACGYVKTVTDARGGLTTWTYDQTKCTLTNVVQPIVVNGVTGSNAVPTTGYTYVASGLIDTITDPSGVVVDYGYDASGNRTSRTVNPGGLNLVTTYGYDGVGNITSVTNGNNHATSYAYDGDRRVELITAPTGTCQVTGNVWTGGLVAKVRLAKVCSPNFATDADWQVWTKTYTPTDRIDVETDPAGDTLDTDYDALDRIEHLRQSVGGGAPVRVTRTQYDAAGQVYREYRALGTADEIVYAEYGYSPDGRPEWFKDARANLTDLDYDGYGRLITTTFPDLSFEQLGYDDNGNVTSRRNRSGRTLTMAYDALDRETSRSVPDHPGVPGNYARTLTSTYDLASRPYDQGAEGQTLKSRYDAAGRLLRVEDSLLNTLGANMGNVEYTYDPASNRQTMLFRTGGGASWTQTYTYDTAERLFQLKEGATVLAQYGYDPLARLTSLAYVDTSSAARTYEPDDDLATLTHTYNGGSLGFSYTSNGAAQLRTIATANGSLLVGPPAAPASYTPNLLNQYSAVEAASLTYDANGNLTGDGLWTYRYDEENRLRQVSRPGLTADYAYDPQGRRRAKTVNGTTTYFIHDGPNELAELNATGTRQRFYLNGLGMDERVGLHDDAGGTGWQFFHANHQGSVVMTTLASTGGGVGAILDYGAFGESVTTGTGNPIRYTGRYLDAESGLYYYRARYYSPALGRFLQTDPVGIKDDLNMYAYVRSDPVNNTDPTGQEGVGCWNNGDGCATGATVGASARAAYVGIKSSQTRATYESKTGKLEPTDSAGRSAAKAEARSNTPTEVKAGIEARQPGLGPKEGSGATANRTNATANQAAQNLGKVGKIAGAVAAASAVTDIATSDNRARAAAANAGAIAGGLAGGKIGASIGALGGPVAPITAPVGGLLGGAVGGAVGYEAGERAYDEVTE
jgi:RHS repeat-associated protein